MHKITGFCSYQCIEHFLKSMLDLFKRKCLKLYALNMKHEIPGNINVI